MDIIYIIAPIIVGFFGCSVSSTRIITQGNQAVVERWGKYQRTLDPGLNFIIPVIDTIAVEESTRGRISDIKPQPTVTKDNVSVDIDILIHWRVFDLEKVYYQTEEVDKVEDVEDAVKSLVIETLHSVISHLQLDEIRVSRSKLNQTLLEKLNQVTDHWGVKVLRLEIQEIKLPESITEFLENREVA
ncbi:MAG: paraslipin [Symploca sp. SIO2E6]|nr:paraslipin [Symploca sp. SIO2E6]